MTPGGLADSTRLFLAAAATSLSPFSPLSGALRLEYNGTWVRSDDRNPLPHRADNWKTNFTAVLSSTSPRLVDRVSGQILPLSKLFPQAEEEELPWIEGSYLLKDHWCKLALGDVLDGEHCFVRTDLVARYCLLEFVLSTSSSDFFIARARPAHGEAAPGGRVLIQLPKSRDLLEQRAGDEVWALKKVCETSPHRGQSSFLHPTADAAKMAVYGAVCTSWPYDSPVYAVSMPHAAKALDSLGPLAFLRKGLEALVALNAAKLVHGRITAQNLLIVGEQLLIVGLAKAGAGRSSPPKEYQNSTILGKVLRSGSANNRPWSLHLDTLVVKETLAGFMSVEKKEASSEKLLEPTHEDDVAAFVKLAFDLYKGHSELDNKKWQDLLSRVSVSGKQRPTAEVLLQHDVLRESTGSYTSSNQRNSALDSSTRSLGSTGSPCRTDSSSSINSTSSSLSQSKHEDPSLKTQKNSAPNGSNDSPTKQEKEGQDDLVGWYVVH